MKPWFRKPRSVTLGALLFALLLFLKGCLANAIARRPQAFNGLRRVYRALLALLVTRTGLFDAAYYAECNPDVVQAGWDPLRHYVEIGEREGRLPMPLFDPLHYVAQLQGAPVLNALLHFAWVGRRRGLSPSPWFSPEYYLQGNPDVAAQRLDPLAHYLRHGALEGRSPCAAFDGLFYLRANPDIAEARVNPLLHYLRYGRTEGRRPLPAGEGGATPEPAAPGELQQVFAPGAADWSAALARPDQDGARVDVIVPVYKGRAETLRCLLSVLTAPCQTPFALIVIDDASPDQELSQELRELAQKNLFTLLANEQNLGFVRTVNRGMALHEDRDIVLLNADTEVYGNWLDRLLQVAERQPRAGTITPLSNNATICSYPRFLQDNPYPLELAPAELDALAAEHNAGVIAEAPTGVGFCLYIRRSCLAQIGPFDADRFGKGYGEENDFCQRALRRGWRNLIAAEVFVRHWGSASFAVEKSARVKTALEVIDRLYPSYHRDVAQFIAADPLRPARECLDWQRFRRQARTRNVLIVCHSRGGGTERLVREDMQRLQQQGCGVFLLRPQIGHAARVVLSHPLVRIAPNLREFPLEDGPRLAQACRELGITEVHTHSFVDFAPQATAQVRALCAALGARLEMRVHDYEVICPRINLADQDGLYCGEPEPAGCNQCLLTRGSESRATDIVRWRARYGELIATAERVIVPDSDVAQRLAHYFPQAPLAVVPHESLRVAPLHSPAVAPGARLRIVVPGAISRFKGYGILRACASAARRDGLPLQFVLMGYSADDSALQASGVEITGRYLESQAQTLLDKLEPHVIWLPSTWPETYSYTLSLALATGYPVFAFDLGAIAGRLKALGRGQQLLPLAAMQDAARVNERFMAYRASSGGEAGMAGSGALVDVAAP